MSSHLSQLAYEYLQRQLLANRLQSGTKVSELTVARELGISRTPVREAIRRLQAEGLLYQIPSSGTYVAEPGRKQIVDAHETRLALELYLVRRGVPRLDQQDLARLARYVREMRALAHDFRAQQQPYLSASLQESLLKVEQDFHATLLSPTDNELAGKVIHEVDLRLRIFVQRAHRLSLSDIAKTLLSYHRIAVACRQGDGELAAQALEMYLGRQLRRAFACLESGPPRVVQAV